MKGLNLIRPCVFALSVLLVLPGRALPDGVSFRRLTVQEGLSQSWVRAIHQDRTGIMWFGTAEGLNRFDGIAFTVTTRNSRDPGGLGSSSIQSIAEDSLGRLWIGTENGLNRYDPAQDRFTRSERWPGGFITGITGNGDGRLVVTTRDRGLFLFDPKTDSVRSWIYDEREAQRYADRAINAVLRDREGNLWFGTHDGLDMLAAAGRNTLRFTKTPGGGSGLSDDDIRTLLQDREGRIWAGAGRGGLNLLTAGPGHPEKIRFTHFIHDPKNPSGIGPGAVLALLEDKTGHLWVGLENGGLDRARFQRGSEKEALFRHFRLVPQDPSSLSNNSIHALAEDREGGIWAGTYGNGINYTHPLRKKFDHVRQIPGLANSLNSDFINALLEEGPVLWIGTEGGLTRFDRNRGTFRHFVHDPDDGRSIGSDAVWKIFRDSRGDLWIGTWGGGLNLLDRKSGAFIRFEHDPRRSGTISGNNIFSIAEDKSGALWVGTMGDGLNRMDPRTRVFRSYRYDPRNPRGLANDYVNALLIDSRNRIWIATTLTVDVFDPASGAFLHYRHEPARPRSLSANGATVFFEDSRKNLWIGTVEGLNVYNPETDDFDCIDTDSGLPNNHIKSILEDSNGNLWIATNRGLSKFVDGTKRPDKPSFIHYDPGDGLQGNEFIKRSCWRSPDGRMYFGGNNGYNFFNPDSLRKNPFIPQVILTGFSLFNRPVRPGDRDSPLKNVIGMTDEIVLNHRQSVMAFEFASLSYLMPEKNRFAYRMEGFDPDWIEAGTARSATYTNLGAGRYTFRVKGSNNDGLWNERGASVRVRIQPPFWGAWWFRLAGLASAAFLLIAGMRMRTHRIRKLNRELEKGIRERTAELEASNREIEAFSHSVSHDLRAPLRSLNGFSKALLDDYGPRLDDTGRDYLGRIRRASENMGRLIDDLLRLSRLTREGMKMRDVDLGRIAGTIVDEHRQAHPGRRILFQCAAGTVVQGDEPLLTILMRNLIDNAVKFSSRRPESAIEFGCLAGGTTPVFFLRDNGVGFDMAYAHSLFGVFQRQHPDFDGVGIGLATVRRIVDRHNGSVWAEGRVDGGAVFYFTIGRKRPTDFGEV
jgi:ligand-binding sensor domain-containing protein/signal transduction histidine kinase